MNQDQRDPREIAVPGDASRSLAQAKDPRMLSTRTLEDRRLIHRHDSVRVQADAFRDLRTSLLNLGGAHNFVTLVAPVIPGCGGSFVARNLSAAFAFDETKSALLIDCDALRPTQHKALGVEANMGGLMDYLDSGTVEMSDVQYFTGIPGLHLIPSGTTREISGELFSSFRMRTMIDSLRNNTPNGYVILDGPSALNSPDARILADLADLVVLVAGYGRVTIEQIDKAAAHFEPAKLAGIVFNDVH